MGSQEAIRVIFNTCLAILSDESADCNVMCVAWQRTGSALSSAFMVKNEFKIARILLLLVAAWGLI